MFRSLFLLALMASSCLGQSYTLNTAGFSYVNHELNWNIPNSGPDLHKFDLGGGEALSVTSSLNGDAAESTVDGWESTLLAEMAIDVDSYQDAETTQGFGEAYLNRSWTVFGNGTATLTWIVEVDIDPETLSGWPFTDPRQFLSGSSRVVNVDSGEDRTFEWQLKGAFYAGSWACYTEWRILDQSGATLQSGVTLINSAVAVQTTLPVLNADSLVGFALTKADAYQSVPGWYAQRKGEGYTKLIIH